ncbi:hypothetical protein [Paenibacillus lentus]|uniref:Uncharacterized protein n=1 Tax=Paenibacillus lentus TaxID=1338368 RepID=A0A3Q8S8Y3_9BACL|nr:hypothetical protein [Paenibacillus lentus]AZK45039.1 hypothetical protein EIM92_01550 [Paenibacillus lentus]
MFIQFSEYDLLELFESEPISISDTEAGMFIYSKTDIQGLKLVLTVSIYEQECLLSLNHESYSIPIINLTLKDVTQISKNNDKLNFQFENGEKNIDVLFKPNFAFSNLVNI